MPAIIVDPDEIAQLHAKRAGAGEWSREEMWDGVLYMPPLANNEHQEVQWNLGIPLHDTVVTAGLGMAYPGVNVSDVHHGWEKNHRGPDLAVYLAGNPAVNHGTHWQGGPDFLVEIMSPGEDPQAKFGFYATVNTREVLIVNRYPWAVEVHQLQGSRLVLARRSDLANPTEVMSGVLPLAFRLQPGQPRPTIHVRHAGTGQTWTA